MVGFRADTDGLPIAEETGLDYASTATGTLPDGATAPTMHGCGHDTHITSALATAQYLQDHPESWQGTVVFIFQPGEETAYGAKAMVNDGLWDKAPRPDVLLAQHVMPIEAGKFALRAGNMASLADSWRITVRGRQAHGSQPENSLDPIVAASAMVMRLQTIVSRELAPMTPAVVTVGTFHAGLKENIIPESAEFSINVRTPDEQVRTQVLNSIRRIVAAEAMASGISEPAIVEINRFPACLTMASTPPVPREPLKAGLVKGASWTSRWVWVQRMPVGWATPLACPWYSGPLAHSPQQSLRTASPRQVTTLHNSRRMPSWPFVTGPEQRWPPCTNILASNQCPVRWQFQRLPPHVAR